MVSVIVFTDYTGYSISIDYSIYLQIIIILHILCLFFVIERICVCSCSREAVHAVHAGVASVHAGGGEGVQLCEGEPFSGPTPLLPSQEVHLRYQAHSNRGAHVLLLPS